MPLSLARALSFSRTGPRPDIELVRGAAVVARFQDPTFSAEVERLYQACPWGTAGQRADFLRIWLEHYGGRYEPLLALHRGPDGALAGLLPLARNGETLEYAGAYDCEYRVWLALPEVSDAFIEAALLAVRRDTGLRIDLHCLPPGTPLDWTRRPSRLLPFLETSHETRLVIPLQDPAAIAKWVKDRSRLRTAWNKLSRTGKVVFRRVRDVGEVGQVLQQWAPMYDLRKGAVYGLTPFRDDPIKRPFLLAQAAVPDLLHVTALERDGELLAAHIATAGTRELSLMGVAHSEFESKLSPGSLLIFELVQLAAREGFALLDLTPGTDAYKARFASDEEPVHNVTVHADVISSGKRLARAGLRAAKHRAEAYVAAQATARPEGWAARARPWLDRLRRPADGNAAAPRLRPAVGVVSLEGRLPADTGGTDAKDAARAAGADWRRNHLDHIVRYQGPHESYLGLLRDLTTAVRAGGELHTRAAPGALAMAAYLMPATAVDNAGAPEDAHVLYIGYVGDGAPTEGESNGVTREDQARALLALARALPPPQRARLRVAAADPAHAPLLPLIERYCQA